MTSRSVWLIVCGEVERGDDAVGPIALDGLPTDLVGRCHAQRAAALDVQTLLDVPAGAACLVVDAAVGIPAGSIVTIPLERLDRPRIDGRVDASPRSSHELPVQQVLALARVLRGRLPDGSFVGIGAVEGRFGRSLSPAVAAALPAFRSAIGAEIERLAAGCGTIDPDGHDQGSLRRVGGALPDLVGTGPGADGVAPAGPLPARGR
jgi:hydrogenase maturation protease